jgi:hypothetical protein
LEILFIDKRGELIYIHTMFCFIITDESSRKITHGQSWKKKLWNINILLWNSNAIYENHLQIYQSSLPWQVFWLNSNWILAVRCWRVYFNKYHIITVLVPWVKSPCLISFQLFDGLIYFSRWHIKGNTCVYKVSVHML